MNSHVVIPVLIAFVISLVLGPVVIPFLRRLKMGQTERGGCTVSFEEGRNTDNGRYYHSGSCCDYVPVLCERLSKDHPGTFPYSRIRTDWISG